MANFVSAATIVPALLAYYLSSDSHITFLLSFAGGNFIYITASDLIPEVKPSAPAQQPYSVRGVRPVIVVTLMLLQG